MRVDLRVPAEARRLWHDVEHQLVTFGDDENVSGGRHLPEDVTDLAHRLQGCIQHRKVERHPERMRRYIGRRIGVGDAELMLVAKTAHQAGVLNRTGLHSGGDVEQTTDRRWTRRHVARLPRHVLFADGTGSVEAHTHVEALGIDRQWDQAASGEPLLDLIEIIEREKIEEWTIGFAKRDGRPRARG